MSRSEVIKFLILRTVGNFLVLFAIFGVLATFGPVLYYEIQFRLTQLSGVRYTVVEPKKEVKKALPSQKSSTGFAAILSGKKEQVLMPIDTEFSILIPKIGANAKVFPNIDSSSENEFLPILQQGVAHAKGTVFPGMKGNIYLFAHSTDNFWNVGRYNAVFYLIKDLKAGDDVIIFFENRRHNYMVEDVRILEASEVDPLTKSQDTKKETLILQSCWPPGTTWKRLLVFAKPK